MKSFVILLVLFISLNSDAKTFSPQLFEAQDFLEEMEESFQPYFYKFHQNLYFDYKHSEEAECADFYNSSFKLYACLYTERDAQHLSQRLELLSKGKKKITIHLEITHESSAPDALTLYEMLNFSFPQITIDTRFYRLHFSDFEMFFNFERQENAERFEFYTTPQNFTVNAHAFYEDTKLSERKFKRLYRSAYDLPGGLEIPKAQVLATKMEGELYNFDYFLEGTHEVSPHEFKQVVKRGFDENFAYLFDSYLIYLKAIHQWPTYE